MIVPTTTGRGDFEGFSSRSAKGLNFTSISALSSVFFPKKKTRENLIFENSRIEGISNSIDLFSHSIENALIPSSKSEVMNEDLAVFRK